MPGSSSMSAVPGVAWRTGAFRFSLALRTELNGR
jgi:hypothetical protein